ncbi:hypothetical protein PsorP6_017065 [Peronosclerospora sorghi]|uniref:Uncharacterized protein n=1 Tax=Peronosclerospora sorghi TaxID=230839 RepID=A0ACC0WEU1_9STRA|nr:hypothetical protein PsorP6_017065 [Peronosclerospora sorghi]
MDGADGGDKIIYSTATGAFFGAAIGSIESVWAIPKLGALRVMFLYLVCDKLPMLSAQLKHVGTRTLVFASVGFIFSAGEYLSASIRQKNDPINTGVGAALAGVVPGIVKQSMRVGVGASVTMGAAACAASYWYVAMQSIHSCDELLELMFMFCRQSQQSSGFEKYAAAHRADRS